MRPIAIPVVLLTVGLLAAGLPQERAHADEAAEGLRRIAAARVLANECPDLLLDEAEAGRQAAMLAGRALDVDARIREEKTKFMVEIVPTVRRRDMCATALAYFGEFGLAARRLLRKAE